MTGAILLLRVHDFMLPWLQTALVTLFYRGYLGYRYYCRFCYRGFHCSLVTVVARMAVCHSTHIFSLFSFNMSCIIFQLLISAEFELMEVMIQDISPY